jgi:hypothetical protein
MANNKNKSKINNITLKSNEHTQQPVQQKSNDKFIEKGA